MSKLPSQAKLALVLTALLVAAVTGYFVVVAPQRSKSAELERQIDEAQAQIAAAQAGGPESDVKPIRVADLFELSRAMPDTPDLPNMLLQLSQIASETGVNFQSITPHDPEPIGSYQRIPIDLVFQGHFYDLSDFLYRLRNLVGVHDGALDATGRLFAVNSISFDEGDLEFPEVRASLTVDAYLFGDGTADAPPPAATAATAQPVAPAATTPATDGGSQPVPALPSSAAAPATTPRGASPARS